MSSRAEPYRILRTYHVVDIDPCADTVRLVSHDDGWDEMAFDLEEWVSLHRPWRCFLVETQSGQIGVMSDSR